MGAMRRHGAHQVAQKSTSTTPLFTSSPKFASVNVFTLSDAMSLFYPYVLDAALRARLRGCNCLYILTYSAAERSHEKSAFMPFFCRRVQTFLFGYAASAAVTALIIAPGV